MLLSWGETLISHGCGLPVAENAACEDMGHGVMCPALDIYLRESGAVVAVMMDNVRVEARPKHARLISKCLSWPLLQSVSSHKYVTRQYSTDPLNHMTGPLHRALNKT